MKEGRNKTDKATVLLRVGEILRILLDGAKFWDVTEYVREKEREKGSAWELGEGDEPLSDRTLWRYIASARRCIARGNEEVRDEEMRMHLARRDNLYAKAVNAGDIRTALTVLMDLAKLRNLYPSPDASVSAEVAKLEERLRALIGAQKPAEAAH